MPTGCSLSLEPELRLNVLAMSNEERRRAVAVADVSAARRPFQPSQRCPELVPKTGRNALRAES